jgi:hypothetical protein
VQVRHASYELYAPNDSIAQSARAELDHAASSFQDHFGQAPPPIGVVMFGSAEEMRTFDWSPIRARAREVLPWFHSLEAVRRSAYPRWRGNARFPMRRATCS